MLRLKTHILVIFLCGVFAFAFAQTNETFPFMGRVKAKDINVRIDSKVNSAVICQVRENDRLEVVSGIYDWYKIRLPKYAPAYIHKEMLELVDAQTAKVAKDSVNVRLLPGESSPIIGRTDGGEAVNILEFRRDWYKIQPVRNSFGWIHKKFVAKDVSMGIAVLSQKLPRTAEKIISEKPAIGKVIVLEGLLRPYGRVFWRKATHKLIDKDKKVYLLKGNKATLNSLTRLKVKISGRIINPSKAKRPLVQVDKIEVLN
jgi:uncharacterized protein YgiM (DUF1202 family)